MSAVISFSEMVIFTRPNTLTEEKSRSQNSCSREKILIQSKTVIIIQWKIWNMILFECACFIIVLILFSGVNEDAYVGRREYFFREKSIVVLT